MNYCALYCLNFKLPNKVVLNLQAVKYAVLFYFMFFSIFYLLMFEQDFYQKLLFFIISFQNSFTFM